jgi:eukaryotic-like serine/threonine-protein kinase
LTASADEQDALLDLFDELLALNEPERAQRLASLDAQTADMLRAMLVADARAGNVLPDVPFASLAGSWDGLEPGQALGSFELLRLVGRGGMGQVYLGRRLGDVQQLAAVKVQLPLVATDETLRRFRLERQMLANLEHPAIARLIECGEDAKGRPYFAMEWIDGVTIDAYCDQNKLDLKARLRLFAQLCDGVDYAHRHLIVHRDIKTSNIMVTSEGQPKLLDFGIAKALDTPTAAMDSTATHARFFSPNHAAPEQVLGAAITIGCDVYALGVLLYQLLSGLRPYELDGLSPREVETQICELTPPAASERLTALQRSDGAVADQLAQQRGSARSGTLIHALRGDLDRIVLHALRKRPEERYASAAELRADVQRYLAGEAVLARGMGRGYRLGKFVGRHKLATALTAGFVIALGVFTLVLWFQAGALRRERDEVARQLQRVKVEQARAEQVTSFIEQTFAQADPNKALGERLTVSEVLETGARTLDFTQFDDPLLRHRMQIALARVMQSLGRDSDAARLMERIDPSLPVAQRAEAISLRAQSLAFSGAIDEGLKLSSESLGLIEGQTDIPTAERGAIWLARGRVLRAAEQIVLARAAAEQALQLLDADSDSQFADYTQALRLRARVLLQLNESQTARNQLNELLKLQQTRLPEHHPALLDTLGLLSNELVYAGEFDAASALIEQRLESAEKVFGSDSLQLAFALNGRALLRTEQGDFDGAGADYDACLDILRRRLSPNHSILSLVVLNSGELELLRGAAKRAEARYREALAMTSDKDRGLTNTGFLRLGLAGALSDQGKFEPARLEIEAALTATASMQGLLFALATAEKAVWLKRQGQDQEAERLWAQATPILDRETSSKYGPRLRLERAMRLLASR